MRTEAQMTTIVTRATKELHLDIARKWGFPAEVMAGSTFGLGVTMMFESGHTAEQIIELTRQLVADLSGDPYDRGAS